MLCSHPFNGLLIQPPLLSLWDSLFRYASWWTCPAPLLQYCRTYVRQSTGIGHANLLLHRPEKIFFAIELDTTKALCPTLYSTSYILVSIIGLLWALPIGSPSLSLNHFFTFAKSGPSPSLGIANSMFKCVLSNTPGVKFALASGKFESLMILSNSSQNSGSYLSYSDQSSRFGFDPS